MLTHSGMNESVRAIDGSASLQSSRGELNQSVSNIVSSSNRSAVVVNKALLDLDRVGQDAFGVGLVGDALGDGLIDLHLAELVEDDDVVVVDQVADELVAGVVGPPCVAEVTGDLGGAAVDNLVVVGFRIFRFGRSLGTGLFACLGISRRLSVALAAGEHNGHHGQNKQQSKELCQILLHFFSSY